MRPNERVSMSQIGEVLEHAFTYLQQINETVASSRDAAASERVKLLLNAFALEQQALADAIEQYARDGYYHPIPVLGREEVADLRGRLEAFEAREGGKLQPVQRNKSHLLFKWLDDLIRDPRVVDPMEDLLGPDILCWNTLFWIKEAGSPSFVSWHQDITYWGLAGGQVVTAWLALSPASVESGCMRVMPGTHEGELMAHEDRYREGNMLTRGQEISVTVD